MIPTNAIGIWYGHIPELSRYLLRGVNQALSAEDTTPFWRPEYRLG
ncbi:MAG TPA: hypothetical protein VFO40_05615 [Chthoniobacterales bacterium]|nr:hypothetical protein [Chthoniobacterales bacterium]